MKDLEKEYIVSELYRLFGYSKKDFNKKYNPLTYEEVIDEKCLHTCNTVQALFDFGISKNTMVSGIDYKAFRLLIFDIRKIARLIIWDIKNQEPSWENHDI